MLEQEIKLFESYLSGEDVDPQALLDASKKVFHASFYLRYFFKAFDAAYTEEKEEAVILYQQFKEAIEEYSL
jgi:hypothetical protein